MVNYRSFRNPDPPALVDVWNESLTGRGAVRLAGCSPLEQQVFSRVYFDPQGLILAEEDGVALGFGHAGFGPNPEETRQDTGTGVVCVVAVRPAHRRRGVGGELLRRCEEYLRARGAARVLAGERYPYAPFYLGLYGGSDLPGVLDSDISAAPFLQHFGYQRGAETLVLQRQVQDPLRVVDPRFVACRQKFEIQAELTGGGLSWWHTSVLGMLEPLDFVLVEKAGGAAVARAGLMELEGFTWKWNRPSVGLYDIRVEERYRGQGIGKFFLTQILRYLQEQCFELIETQIDPDNLPVIQLCRGMGFQQVDLGHVYQRTL